ncbi:MAG: hypothetical protein A2095_02675 [Sphingomonadales bacterium GWF1_63_6]|nr:MAG: hypothetical protein A2095_02675 [Sphingomonadales bacterium GWF1_63_6]
MSEKRAFLALASVHGVGQKTMFGLAESGHRFSEVLDYGPGDTVVGTRAIDQKGEPISQRQWSAIRNNALGRADSLAESLDQLGVSLLFRDDADFPAQLLDLARPPHWLFVQGSTALLHEPSVTIVGTRKPSADGLFLARYVGACLEDWDAPTVSGLAAGIDQLAHEHSLRAGVPTIAVLGTGMLDDYPKGSGVLREHILETGGTVVTEYLPRVSYSAENFVQRNRLQAALGRILIPVEWNRRSGTAHTVRFATQLHRPIACLAMPEWPDERVMLEPGLGLETGAIFTLPRHHARLNEFVLNALRTRKLAWSGQLSFLEEG